MKKYDLLKVLGITFAVIVLLSFVLPAGTISNGEFSSLEATSPIGLYDIIRTPLVTIATFIQYGVLFLIIGGFYGLINKIGISSTIVDKISKTWEKKSGTFLVITIIFFALLTSLIGNNSVLFILVPLFIMMLMKLGYNKLTSFAATVGSMLVGQIGTTLGFGTWGYLKIVFGQLGETFGMTEMILLRIILLVIVVTMFILLVLKNAKKEKDIIPLLSDNKDKKNLLPIIILSVIFLVLLFVGGYNWYYTFNIDFFENLYETITTVEIAGYPIFANILGNISQIGYWGNYDVAAVLVILSIIVSWIYSVKITDAIDGFVDGLKQMIVPAFYAMMASLIFAVMLDSTGNFTFTIVNLLVSSETLSIPGTIGSAIVSSFMYNDFYTMISYFAPFFSTFDANNIPMIALIFQAVYGLVMLIAPTSVFLLVGLSYLQISYKDWVKYIYLYVLSAFGIFIWICIMINVIIPYITNLF